jgi:translation initiation factor IF-3
VQLIGRQQAHPERAVEFLNETIKSLTDFGVPNSSPVIKGRDANVLISPKSHN